MSPIGRPPKPFRNRALQNSISPLPRSGSLNSVTLCCSCDLPAISQRIIKDHNRDPWRIRRKHVSVPDGLLDFAGCQIEFQGCLLSYGEIVASNRKRVRASAFRRYSNQDFILTKFLNRDFEVEEAVWT